MNDLPRKACSFLWILDQGKKKKAKRRESLCNIFILELVHASVVWLALVVLARTRYDGARCVIGSSI